MNGERVTYHYRKQLSDEKTQKMMEGLGMAFVGVRAVRSLSINLIRMRDKAKRMEATGNYTAQEIKMRTGWERGADLRWRYEVPDFAADDNHIRRVANRRELRLADVIAYDKREMFRDMFGDDLYYLPVHVENSKEDFGVFRTKNAVPYDIAINMNAIERAAARGNNVTPSRVLNHEIQHLIQNFEGFESGTSVKGTMTPKKWRRYLTKAGEWEARMVEHRMSLTEDERRRSVAIAEKEPETNIGFKNLRYEDVDVKFIRKVMEIDKDKFCMVKEYAKQLIDNL